MPWWYQMESGGEWAITLSCDAKGLFGMSLRFQFCAVLIQTLPTVGPVAVGGSLRIGRLDASTLCGSSRSRMEV